VLKAALFDLDGTLLRVNTAEFTAEYLKEVALAVTPAVNPDFFTRALLASTSVMIGNRDPGVTNQEVFWKDFRQRMGNRFDNALPFFEEFYASRFQELSRVVRPGASSRPAVEAALGRGLRIVLATQPVFPAAAVQHRMAWAGVDELPWDFVTSYEEMHFCKPHLEYYLEIASRLGVDPRECLMIGNDVQEDLVAASVGMRSCLVTDCLINTQNVDYNVEWSGPLSHLADWLAGADL